MTTTAISAQGSTFKVGTGTGSAKSITGAVRGYPTIVTSVAHGFVNGDVVTIAGSTAPAGLNGTFVVKNATADTFAIELDTTGGSAFAGTVTATPVTFTKISNLQTFKGFDGKVNKLDGTNLDSVAKEWLAGLQDNGSFAFDLHVDMADAGQTALRSFLAARTNNPFKLTLPNGRTATFNAFVESFPIDGGVDKIITASVSLVISGEVIYA